MSADRCIRTRTFRWSAARNLVAIVLATAALLASAAESPSEDQAADTEAQILVMVRMARDGVVLVGRLRGVENGTAHFDETLERDLADGEAACADFIRAVDDHIRANGLDLPREDRPRPSPAPAREIPSMDLAASGITSVIWCTGYGFDFGWLKVPVLDHRGVPQQRRGITSSPGLYFVGLHWMHTYGSAAFFGVGADAAFIADHMRRH